MLRFNGNPSDIQQDDFLARNFYLVEKQIGGLPDINPNKAMFAERLNASKCLIPVKDYDRGDENGAEARASLWETCGPEIKRLAPSPDDLFLFGSPVEGTAAARGARGGSLLVDLPYPSSFNKEDFVPTMESLVRSVKQHLKNSNPVGRGAENYCAHLDTLLQIPNSFHDKHLRIADEMEARAAAVAAADEAEENAKEAFLLKAQAEHKRAVAEAERDAAEREAEVRLAEQAKVEEEVAGLEKKLAEIEAQNEAARRGANGGDGRLLPPSEGPSGQGRAGASSSSSAGGSAVGGRAPGRAPPSMTGEAGTALPAQEQRSSFLTPVAIPGRDVVGPRARSRSPRRAPASGSDLLQQLKDMQTRFGSEMDAMRAEVGKCLQANADHAEKCREEAENQIEALRLQLRLAESQNAELQRRLQNQHQQAEDVATMVGAVAGVGLPIAFGAAQHHAGGL